jgi:hypothetical protein
MPEQKLTQTGLPMLIDSDLANTLDFHVASTDLLNVVDEYANYIATSYVRNYQKHTVDPIYNDAMFFMRLNFSSLNFSTKVTDKALYEVDGYEQGRENIRVLETFAKGAYLSKIDTLLSPHEVWIRGDDDWPELRNSQDGHKQYEITWSPGNIENVSEDQFKSLNLYRSGATVKELPIEYRAINLYTGKERWVPYDNDIKALVKSKLQNLQDGFGLEQMHDEFILYWMDKFRRSHDKTREIYRSLVQSGKQFEITWSGKQFEITWSSGKKEIVSEAMFSGMNLHRSGATVKELPGKKEIVSEDTFNGMNLHRSGATVKELPIDTTNDFFTDLSDSIGILSMVDSVPDSSILPFIDTEFTLLGVTPSVTNGVIDTKIDEETKVLINEMSLKTDNVFKSNISPIINQFNMSTEAHGTDLMTDYNHYGRMIAVQSVLDESVSEVIGKSYKMIGYMREAVNNKKIVSPTINAAIEDSSSRINLLKEKIQSIPRVKTNSDILKANKLTTDRS